MGNFTLDPRLAADSMPLGALSLCELRLMNDCRWPWLLLVPMRADAVEMHDLHPSDQAMLAQEMAHAAKALKAATRALKINTGALGNIVRQLHIHVIARNDGDPNWPGPVWGFGTRQPYTPHDAAAFKERLAPHLFPLENMA